MDPSRTIPMYGYMGWAERSRARITPPCLPGRFCDYLERLLIKEVEQSYIYKGDQSNMVPKAGLEPPRVPPPPPHKVNALTVRNGNPDPLDAYL